jgi:hypothetical protein
MRRRNGGRGDDDFVSAAEIGDFVFCPEAWRLKYGMGLEPENRESLAAGKRHHARKAVAERVAGGAVSLGWRLVVLAVVAVLLWWVLSRRWQRRGWPPSRRWCWCSGCC